MIRNPLFRFLYISIPLVFVGLYGKAQAILPDIQVTTQNGANVISWICQYEGLKSIAVQRSNDSIYNFATIGFVKNLKKGTQAFIDGHPLPGKNFYRLYIAFNSDLTWFSNRIKIVIDSSQLLQKAVLPPNDSLQNMLGNMITENGTADASSLTAYSYVRSQYVFTNPFTGHINIELPEDEKPHDTFSIRFFDSKNLPIFDVPKIPEHSVVLDKRNFQRKGLYKFELMKNNKIIESGFVTIY